MRQSYEMFPRQCASSLCRSGVNLCSIPIQTLAPSIPAVFLNSVPGASHMVPTYTGYFKNEPGGYSHGDSGGTKDQVSIVNSA